MRVPSAWSGTMDAHTDESATMFGSVHASSTWTGEDGSNAWSLQPALTVTPHQTFRLTVGLEFAGMRNDLQYVGMQSGGTTPAYILGRVEQHTLVATVRADYCITPELTIQYYGSPFSSVGRFSDFKSVTSPRAERYGDRFARVDDPVTIQNPDFAFSQFRSTLLPGGSSGPDRMSTSCGLRIARRLRCRVIPRRAPRCGSCGRVHRRMW